MLAWVHLGALVLFFQIYVASCVRGTAAGVVVKMCLCSTNVILHIAHCSSVLVYKTLYALHAQFMEISVRAFLSSKTCMFLGHDSGAERPLINIHPWVWMCAHIVCVHFHAMVLGTPRAGLHERIFQEVEWSFLLAFPSHMSPHPYITVCMNLPSILSRSESNVLTYGFMSTFMRSQHTLIFMNGSC